MTIHCYNIHLCSAYARTHTIMSTSTQPVNIICSVRKCTEKKNQIQWHQCCLKYNTLFWRAFPANNRQPPNQHAAGIRTNERTHAYHS